MKIYEYEVQGLYNGEWECLTTEETRKEALERLKEYRENQPGTCYRIKKVRAE